MLLDSDKDFINTVREASLVFAGVVLRRDTSGISFVPSQPTAVVRVEQALRWPAPLGDFSGDTVIVVLSDTSAVRAGDRAAFFTYGIVVGSSLVVQELQHIPETTPGFVSDLRDRLAVADSIITDRDIQARSVPTVSDGVVLGHVVATDAVPDLSAGRGSEHTPRWGRAYVSVTGAFRVRDSVLMRERVPVLFAIGGSALTEKAPELHTGESHIFWLRKISRLPAELRVGITDTVRQFFILNANDIRPASDSARVARVLSPISGRVVLPPGGGHQ